MPGVDFDRVCSHVSRSLHLSVIRIDKEAHLNAFSAHRLHNLADPVHVGRHVEATLCRKLLPPFGNQGYHVGQNLARDACHFVRCRHFKIERAPHHLPQDADVPVLYVTPVFPQMDDDARCARHFRHTRRVYRVRVMDTPRLPQGRDVIDIHHKLLHILLRNGRHPLQTGSAAPTPASPVYLPILFRTTRTVSGLTFAGKNALTLRGTFTTSCCCCKVTVNRDRLYRTLLARAVPPALPR